MMSKQTKEKFSDRHPKLWFMAQVLGFYGLMLALFLYFMLANLSSAPKYVYTQF